MMVNLYKPRSFHNFEQSPAICGLISLKPEIPTAGATHKPNKHTFQKPVDLLQKYFSLHFFSPAASLQLQNLGGVQANHKQDIFLLHHCFLSFSSYHTSFSSFHYSVFYCIFTEIIFFSPLLPNFYLI